MLRYRGNSADGADRYSKFTSQVRDVRGSRDDVTPGDEMASAAMSRRALIYESIKILIALFGLKTIRSCANVYE